MPGRRRALGARRFLRPGSGRWALVTCVVLGLLALTGCSGLFPRPKPPPEWVPNTQTRVLDDDTLVVLTDVDEQGTLRFSARTAMLDDLSPGNIVVLGVTDQAPYGLLRRVTSVHREGGRTTVATTQAALVDAIDEGRIQVTGTLTSDDVIGTTAADGVALLPSWKGVRYSLDTEIADGVWIRGSLQLQIAYAFTLDISWRGVQYVNFEVSVTERVDLRVEATKAFSRDTEKQIARHRFRPIFVKFVVIVPVLTVYVGVEGSVQASFAADVTQSVTATAGARYKDRWTNLGSFDPQFSFREPQVSVGDIAAQGYAKADLGFLVYGVVGPYAVVTAYLELEADPAARPWWELYGGLSCYAGVKFQIFGYRDDYETGELAGIRRLLAAAPGGSPISRRILIYICSSRNDSDGWYKGPDHVAPVLELLARLGYYAQVYDQTTLPNLTLGVMSQYSQVWVLEGDYDDVVETSAREADDLRRFYQSGGGVWISLETRGSDLGVRYGDWTEDAIPFLERFQIGYGGGIWGTRSVQPVVSSHTLMANVGSICFDREVGYLVLSNPRAQVIWQYESTSPSGSFPAIAVLDERDAGRGRAVFDSGWVLGYAYWKRADNLAFTANVARWLEP